jgi:uncharacterized HAD superfamily protein
MEKKRLEVAMDLDGVLANVTSAVLGRISIDSHTPVTLADVDKWDWLTPMGFAQEYFLETYCSTWEDYPMNAFEPYERLAGQYIAELCEQHNVDIVTGHNESSREAIAAWLKQHKIPYRRLIMHGCFVSKAGLPYDVFVDDSPSFAKKIAADPRGRLYFLFDQLYNADVPETAAVIRIRSLSEITKRLRDMEPANQR